MGYESLLDIILKVVKKLIYAINIIMALDLINHIREKIIMSLKHF